MQCMLYYSQNSYLFLHAVFGTKKTEPFISKIISFLGTILSIPHYKIWDEGKQ